MNKKKHLLHFHVTNNELKEIIYEYYKLKMSIKVKDIDKENCSYYFFDDIINIENFDPNKIKIDEIHTKIFLFTALDM